MENQQLSDQELSENHAIHKKIEYDNFKGKNFALLFQPKGQNETLKCPFCNNTHIHCIGDGHRLSHCTDTSFPPYKKNTSRWIVCDGILFSQKDGYIIRTM